MTRAILAVLAALAVNACATPQEQWDLDNQRRAEAMAAMYPALRGLTSKDQQEMAAECAREVMIMPAAAQATTDVQIGVLIVQCYKDRDWIR